MKANFRSECNGQNIRIQDREYIDYGKYAPILHVLSIIADNLDQINYTLEELSTIIESKKERK